MTGQPNDVAVLLFLEQQARAGEVSSLGRWYLAARAAGLIQELGRRSGGHLRRHLTAEGLMAHMCIGHTHTEPQARATLAWMERRGRNAIGPARCKPGEWRAFFIRHPDVMLASDNPAICSLAAQFKAENDAAAARAAIDNMMGAT